MRSAMPQSSAAMPSGAATWSTHPVPIAAAGIAGSPAERGSSAKTMPPRALIACTPSAPSEPLPPRTTAMAPPSRSIASARSRASTGI